MCNTQKFFVIVLGIPRVNWPAQCADNTSS